jgi:hypothetical protein
MDVNSLSPTTRTAKMYVHLIRLFLVRRLLPLTPLEVTVQGRLRGGPAEIDQGQFFR